MKNSNIKAIILVPLLYLILSSNTIPVLKIEDYYGTYEFCDYESSASYDDVMRDAGYQYKEIVLSQEFFKAKGYGIRNPKYSFRTYGEEYVITVPNQKAYTGTQFLSVFPEITRDSNQVIIVSSETPAIPDVVVEILNCDYLALSYGGGWFLYKKILY